MSGKRKRKRKGNPRKEQVNVVKNSDMEYVPQIIPQKRLC